MIYSKYARDLLVGAALRGGTITFPATYYLALLTEQPNVRTDAYSEIGNITANGYARVSVTNATGSWVVNGVSNAVSSNINSIVFPDPTANWVHGAVLSATPITYIGFFDSATIGAGNLWFYVPISAKTVEAGHFNPTIPVGGLVLRFDQ